MFISALLVVIGGIFLRALLKTRNTSQPNIEVKQTVSDDEQSIWPFAPMPIMTDSEVIFFNKLHDAIPECHIFSQVQLSRIIEPSEDAKKERRFWLNRICRQSIDYVLVDGDAKTVLLAIELDDWSHQNQTSQKADAKKDKALASAGIPILRFDAERMPSIELLRHDIIEVLENYTAYE